MKCYVVFEYTLYGGIQGIIRVFSVEADAEQYCEEYDENRPHDVLSSYVEVDYD